MATAKITLIGFNNYYKNLWDLLMVPSGINKEELINNILLKGGEFEVLYSNPEFMKNMIGVWSSKWMHTMERWVKALSINYDPLENYDRREEWLDDNKRNTQRTESAVGHDDSTSSGSGNTTNERSAFNASDYSPHDKLDSTSSGSNTSNSSTTANGNINENESLKRTGRAHGNIGVTTSQQMLQSELDIAKWNLYDEIADLFLSEFCIYTY